MAKPNTHRRRKKAFQRGVACAVSVARTGDIDLTLFAGRRSVTRTLKASEAKLLAHLLTQKRSQSDGLEGAHGWVPSTPSGAYRRRVVRCNQDNTMGLWVPSSLSAVTAGKCQTPLCEGSWVSSPRLSDSAAQSVCSGCGAVIAAQVCEGRAPIPFVMELPMSDIQASLLRAKWLRAQRLLLEVGAAVAASPHAAELARYVFDGGDLPRPEVQADVAPSNAEVMPEGADLAVWTETQASKARCKADFKKQQERERLPVPIRIATASDAQIEAVVCILNATDGMSSDCWPAGMSMKREMRNLDPRVFELRFAANPSKGLAG